MREAIDEAVVDDHAERRGEGVRFPAVVVPATARAAVLSTSPLARPRCSGHSSQPAAPAAATRRRARCARPARWSTGRLRRIAELLTRGSVIVGDRCDQPRPGSTRREGRAAGAGPGAPRLPAGHATARAALPGTPGALDVPPRGRPDTNAGLRAAVRAPCTSSVTPNPGTPMPAYGRWYARTGINWSSSGRTRPVPVAPSVGPARCVTGWSSPCELLTRAGQQVPAGCRWRGLLATACELPTRGSVSAGPVRSAPSGTTGGRPQSRSGRDSSQSHATAWASPSGPEGRLYWSRPIGWEQATRLRRRSARRRRHTRRRRAARCGRRRSGAPSRSADGLRRDLDRAGSSSAPHRGVGAGSAEPVAGIAARGR